ncbi:type 4a pilus biogenesis protein PilO [Solimonas marina]|uniref:Type 4a pilus biogenesis protein PilO n=1 Tax=Solimonas marina TaxID=2714601 RepID=A0A970B4Z9_9GAMM|nr:type 4a pilus biogenesis protein PilO [Solimonas marina]NKF21158.1 type 4a pilus biogenesis protein PilO [Solimonas marina]
MTPQEVLNQLQTLDANNPGAWPKWVRIAAAIGLAAALIFAGIWVIVRPIHEELVSSRGQELKLRKEFEEKQKKVAALDAYREQLAEMERTFGAMLKQLPSKAEVANLLNDISQTRIASGLDEELFQPQGEVPKEFYAEIPNKIVVVGDYHEMGNFVSGVAALPRIVTIEDVEIKPINAKAGSSTQLRMTAVAKTYRYLDDDEIAAQSQSKNKGKKKGGRK